tara:strand:+ start:32 stop:175 length:144 start_codon:yes stop_codon:yes gene_type:complete
MTMLNQEKEESQINPLTAEDRKLLSDLSSTFDLGTQTIIGLDEEDNL